MLKSATVSPNGTIEKFALLQHADSWYCTRVSKLLVFIYNHYHVVCINRSAQVTEVDETLARDSGSLGLTVAMRRAHCCLGSGVSSGVPLGQCNRANVGNDRPLTSTAAKLSTE